MEKNLPFIFFTDDTVISLELFLKISFVKKIVEPTISIQNSILK